MIYQPVSFMLDLLKKAQEAQIKVASLNDGHSLHLDTSSTPNYGSSGFHFSFDVTLFEGTEIVSSWDFNSVDSPDELAHMLDGLMLKINRL